MERFSWSQKFYKGKTYFKPCFQLFKKNEWGQFEKFHQVYHGEQEGEMISAMRKNLICNGENLRPKPIYEAKSGKESTKDQVLDKIAYE